MEAKEVWSSSKSLIPRELKAAYKAPFPGLVSILPDSELALGEQPYPQGIVKIIRRRYLTSQLSKTAIPFGVNRSLTQKFKKGKIGNKMSMVKFEKLQNISWNLLGHAHV